MGSSLAALSLRRGAISSRGVRTPRILPLSPTMKQAPLPLSLMPHATSRTEASCPTERGLVSMTPVTLPGKREVRLPTLSPVVALDAGVMKVRTMSSAVTSPTSLPYSTMGTWLIPLSSMRRRAWETFSSMSREKTGLLMSSLAGWPESSGAPHMALTMSTWEITPTICFISVTGTTRMLFLTSISAASRTVLSGETESVPLQIPSILVWAG